MCKIRFLCRSLDTCLVFLLVIAGWTTLARCQTEKSTIIASSSPDSLLAIDNEHTTITNVSTENMKANLTTTDSSQKVTNVSSKTSSPKDVESTTTMKTDSSVTKESKPEEISSSHQQAMRKIEVNKSSQQNKKNSRTAAHYMGMQNYSAKAPQDAKDSATKTRSSSQRTKFKQKTSDPLTPAHYRSLAPSSKYCKVDDEHPGCKYKGINKKNCRQVLARGLTSKEQQTILILHNGWRAVFAKGIFGLPQAANMAKLGWDAEASAIAQLMLDQCNDTAITGAPSWATVKSKEGPLKHGLTMFTSDERWDNDKRSVMTTSTATMSFLTKEWSPSVTEIINEQAKQERDTQLQLRKGTQRLNIEYKQIALANTISVGCGFIKYIYETYHDRELMTVNKLLCYYPTAAGISNGNQFYEPGKPCSKCPIGRKKCEDGLCELGKPRPSRSQRRAKVPGK